MVLTSPVLLICDRLRSNPLLCEAHTWRLTLSKEPLFDDQTLVVYSLLSVRPSYTRHRSYDFRATSEVIHYACDVQAYAGRKISRKSTTSTDLTYDLSKFDVTARTLTVRYYQGRHQVQQNGWTISVECGEGRPVPVRGRV